MALQRRISVRVNGILLPIHESSTLNDITIFTPQPKTEHVPPVSSSGLDGPGDTVDSTGFSAHSSNKGKQTLRNSRAEMATAMANTSALNKYHESINLDGSHPDLHQPPSALAELQNKIAREQDPKKQKLMKADFRKMQKAEAKKAKQEKRTARNSQLEAQKKAAIEKLVVRQLHDKTAERCEEICHPVRSGTPNSTGSPFRMITYYDKKLGGIPKLQALDNNPPNLFLQVKTKSWYHKEIRLFLGDKKGPMIAQANSSMGFQNFVAFESLDSWKLSKREKHDPLLIPLKAPRAQLAKYDFTLPFGSEEGGISDYQVENKSFTWERTNYNSMSGDFKFELRETNPKNGSGEGEVLAMLTYKCGYVDNTGFSKLTMKRRFGRDIARRGADKLSDWTDWEVMTLMSGLCIVEAHKSWEHRKRIQGYKN